MYHATETYLASLHVHPHDGPAYTVDIAQKTVWRELQQAGELMMRR